MLPAFCLLAALHPYAQAPVAVGSAGIPGAASGVSVGSISFATEALSAGSIPVAVASAPEPAAPAPVPAAPAPAPVPVACEPAVPLDEPRITDQRLVRVLAGDLLLHEMPVEEPCFGLVALASDVVFDKVSWR